MFTSSIKIPHALDLSSVYSSTSSNFEGGRLPQMPGQLPYGYISSEQRLHLGAAQLPTGKIIDDLKQLESLCRAARHVFGDVKKFDAIVSSVGPLVLESSAPIPRALEALRKVLDGSDIESRVYRSSARIGSAAIGKRLNGRELGELRDVLLEGALVSTAVCAFDRAAVVEPLNPLKSIVNFLTGAPKPTHSVVREYARTTPFDKHAPFHLRLSLDTWAQRISQADDGAPEIAAMCGVEHRVCSLLSAFDLSRKTSISAGQVSSTLSLHSKDDGTLAFEGDVKLAQLFPVLILAQRSSDLIHRLLTVERVDLVRLCALAHRDVGMEMSVRLERLSPGTHVRLSDVLEWSALFESQKDVVLSNAQRADLAALLLDAEAVLDIMRSLKDVLGQPWSEPWWRSQWKRAISDREIRVALNLLDGAPAFQDFDYTEPAQLAMEGALSLGYSQDDREGRGFGTPENPVQSLAWLLSRSVQSNDIETLPD